MLRRRASDRLQFYGTMAGLALLGFTFAVKFWQPATSDALVLGLVAAAGTLIHPSWVIDQFRREESHGSTDGSDRADRDGA
jgi:hypothetical protein